MRRPAVVLLAAGCALLTAACGAAGGAAPPTWEPSPAGASEGPGVSISPIVPAPPTGSGSPSQPGDSAAPNSPSPGSSSTTKIDPFVVATKLSSPIGLTMLPDGTALVGERTTGRIVRVQPVAGKPVPTVKTISGIDPAGDGGLLDLALSPDYSQDNLVYAYLTTRTDNRVVEFTLTGPVTPVLTGIPRGATGNAGRISFDASGNLLVSTGDAGKPSAAADPASLAGKVLRVDSIGKPVAGNPRSGSAVYSSGHQGPSSLCPVSQTSAVLEVEPGSAAGSRAGEVNLLQAGGAYGYPTASASAIRPLASLPTSTPVPGDCAVAAGRLWVTSLDGQALLDAPYTEAATSIDIGKFSAVLTRKYGRLKTVVAASDGALWLTTSNRDGHGKPVAADERVIRYVPSGGSSKTNAPY